MSTFTSFSNEVSIRYDKHASRVLSTDYWRSLDSFRYYLRYKNSNIYVDVPAGVLTDGASTPRFLWPIIPPWGLYAQAVILHDRLCEYPFITIYKFNREYVEMIDRKEVDRIFFEALRVLEVPKIKYYLIRTGVTAYRVIGRAKAGKEINPIKRKMELEFNQDTKMTLLMGGLLPDVMN